MKAYIRYVRRHISYEVVFVGAAILSIVLLGIEVLGNPSPSTVSLYHRIDFFIAIFFTTDFLVGWYATKDSKKYWKNNWLILLSSIPISEDIFRAFRLLRIFRILRLIRAFHNATHSPRKTHKKADSK